MGFYDVLLCFEKKKFWTWDSVTGSRREHKPNEIKPVYLLNLTLCKVLFVCFCGDGAVKGLDEKGFAFSNAADSLTRTGVVVLSYL